MKRRSKQSGQKDKATDAPSMSAITEELGLFSLTHSVAARPQAEANAFGLEFSFGGERPPSNLGVRQGDHSRAYALIKHLVERRCAYQPIDVALKQLFHIFSVYLYLDDEEEASSITKQVKIALNDEQCFNSTEIDELCTLLREGGADDKQIEKAKCGWLLANTRMLERVFREMAAHYLTVANQKALTAFPAEGNVQPLAGEGQRVKAALRFLDGLNELKIRESVVDEIGIAVALCHLFWYPRIPDDELCDTAQWEKVQHKYRKGVAPRTNNRDTLCQVLEGYLALVFECYPVMHNRQDAIIDIFLQSVLDDDDNPDKIKYSWNLDDAQKKAVAKTVKSNLDTLYGFFEERLKGSRKSAPQAVAQSSSSDGRGSRNSSDDSAGLDTTFVTAETTGSAGSPLGSGNSDEGPAIPEFKIDANGQRIRFTFDEILQDQQSVSRP